MPETHGTKADGTPITDDMVEAMADEAERGYDVEEIRRRRGGRRAMGPAPSSVESVRLDPEFKRELLLHAAEQHISVREALRRATGRYLHQPPSDETHSDVAARRHLLLQLYTLERQDQQAAMHQHLATIGAALAYVVPVGALLLSKCRVGAGCVVGEAGLFIVPLLAPLPALGFLGFLLSNQALLERRAHYLRQLEKGLGSTRPLDREPFPFFMGKVLPQVFGPDPPWFMSLAAYIWAVVAFVVAAALTAAAMVYLPDGPGAWIARGVYTLLLFGLLLAALEVSWLNRHKPETSRLPRALSKLTLTRMRGHVRIDGDEETPASGSATDR